MRLGGDCPQLSDVKLAEKPLDAQKLLRAPSCSHQTAKILFLLANLVIFCVSCWYLCTQLTIMCLQLPNCRSNYPQ